MIPIGIGLGLALKIIEVKNELSRGVRVGACLVCIAAGRSCDQFAAYRADIEGTFFSILDASPRFAANIRFGFPGEGQYRDRLASPAGRLLCQPQPLSRQRRFVI